MAMDSVDDRYDGCRDETLKGLPARLKSELAASSDFEVAWKASSSAYAVVPGGRPEHGQALQAYAFEGNSGFRNKFNNAVATMGGNQSFPFYSLHFLLTDAITLLSGKGDACRTVYSVSKQLYSAQKGAKVKLGTFTSASASASSLVEDPDVEGGVLFNITSCLAVNLEIKWGEMETLLLPTEEYTVEDIQKIDSEDGYSYTIISYTIITLKHAGFSSKNNCYLTPR